MKLLSSSTTRLQQIQLTFLSRSQQRLYLHPTHQISKQNHHATMPLVVPGITSNSGGNKDEWLNKLVGKKISESSNETCFAKKDLPETHRIVKPGEFTTMDHQPDRLNIHLDENDNVRDVNYG
ncbi:hypothetical protein BJY00DRAFT_276162 [Aspergillus carlsbadensis]|nr:hypothetical protein BJY00DRAFT_276162 [Aspergillus carlsbadensis]